jgi:hypothetical protein
MVAIKKFSGHPAPMILLYGNEGSGKTSLGLDAPGSIYLPIVPEAPPRHLTPDSFDDVGSFPELIEALRYLFAHPGPYKTLVIDSLSALEPLIWAEACRRNKWKDIEAPGFGKGYMAADEVWRDLFHACRSLGTKRGIMLIFIAHADSSNVEEPGMPPFRKYTVRLHKRGEAIATQACDAILFLHTKVTVKTVDAGFNRKDTYAEGGNVRWLATDGRAHFVAKNRFNMPDMIMVPKDQPWSVVAPYIQPPELVEPELPLITPSVQPPATVPAPTVVPAAPAVNGSKAPGLADVVEKYELQVNPPSSQAEMSVALDGDKLPL